MAEEIKWLDAHMHFWDTEGKTKENNNHILGEAGVYLPADYAKDMEGIPLAGAVHVEAFPTDQVAETRWMEELVAAGAPIKAIVANANLSMQKEGPASRSMQAEGEEALRAILAGHKEASSKAAGIRWVLNHEPNWPQVYRGDYVTTDEQFRRGFALLQEYGYKFELQTNPHQNKDAAAFLAGFPDTLVMVDHIGCLKLPEDPSQEETVMAEWREGMQALAALPHTYCKLSMFHYTLPFWWQSQDKKEKVKAIARELIDMFGAKRCCFASNYPADRVADQPEGTLKQHYDAFVWMVEDLPFEDRKFLFHNTAATFYNAA